MSAAVDANGIHAEQPLKFRKRELEIDADRVRFRVVPSDKVGQSLNFSRDMLRDWQTPEATTEAPPERASGGQNSGTYSFDLIDPSTGLK